jgi:hypothetical protein
VPRKRPRARLLLETVVCEDDDKYKDHGKNTRHYASTNCEVPTRSQSPTRKVDPNQHDDDDGEDEDQLTVLVVNDYSRLVSSQAFDKCDNKTERPRMYNASLKEVYDNRQRYQTHNELIAVNATNRAAANVQPPVQKQFREREAPSDLRIESLNAPST